MLRKYPALIGLIFLILGSLNPPLWIIILITIIGALSLLRGWLSAWLLLIPVGAFHYWVHQIPYPNDVSNLKRQKIVAEGSLKGTHVLKVERVFFDTVAINATGTIGIIPKLDFLWGSKLRVEGTVDTPPDTSNFNWKEYFRGEGTNSILKVRYLKRLENQSLLFRLRKNLFNLVSQNIGGEESRALILALLLGDRTRLSPEIKMSFRRTGTFHLLALSGLHVGFIFSLILMFLVLFRVPMRASLGISILGLILYLLVIGPRPSLVRGTVFVISFVIAYLVERPVVVLNSLGFAGLLSLFLFPYWLFNLGFQLSYLATLGILLLVPLIPMFRNQILNKVLILFAVSVFAQLFVSPLLASKIGGISLGAPVLNVPLVVLTWLLLAEGFMATLFHPVSVWISKPFWILTEFIARLIIFITKTFASLDWIYIELKWGIKETMIGYVVVATLTLTALLLRKFVARSKV